MLAENDAVEVDLTPEKEIKGQIEQANDIVDHQMESEPENKVESGDKEKANIIPDKDVPPVDDDVTQTDPVSKTDTVSETDIIPQVEIVLAKNQDSPQQKTKEKKRQQSQKVKQIVGRFSVCGRCSFFLAGCRVVIGEEALEKAVPQNRSDWMILPWNNETANLVHKSFGSRVDIHCYHFEGRCQECHRRFIYHAAETETENEEPTFRIEL